jgi:hypothetical protein
MPRLPKQNMVSMGDFIYGDKDHIRRTPGFYNLHYRAGEGKADRDCDSSVI